MSLQPDEAPRGERRVVTPEEKIVADILHGLREKYFPQAEIQTYGTGFEDDYESPNRSEYRAVYYTAEDMCEDGEMVEGVPNIEHRFEVRSGIDLFARFQEFKQRNAGSFRGNGWTEAKQMFYRSFLDTIRHSQSYKDLFRAMCEIFRVLDETPPCDALGNEAPSCHIPIYPRRIDSYLLELLTRPSQEETEQKHEEIVERMRQTPWFPEKDQQIDAFERLGLPAACPDGGPEEYDTELRAIVSVNIRFGVAETLAPQIDQDALSRYLPSL